jgi:hypothetical protein
MTISQIAAPTAKVSGARLAKDHGSTVERPKPDPAVNKMMETAIAPSAPPIIAAQSVTRVAVVAEEGAPTMTSSISVTAIAGLRTMTLPPMVRKNKTAMGNKNLVILFRGSIAAYFHGLRSTQKEAEAA